jgi:hypothetical protein
MAHDRTGAIATSVEKHQNASSIAARNDRPLPRYAAEIGRSELDILRDRPDGTNLVQPLAPLGPTDGSGLCGQQCTHSVDLVLSHFLH